MNLFRARKISKGSLKNRYQDQNIKEWGSKYDSVGILDWRDTFDMTKETYCKFTKVKLPNNVLTHLCLQSKVMKYK